MPVALTEHLDRRGPPNAFNSYFLALTPHACRSPDKRLLKGMRGRVHSWVWPVNDRMPTVLYIKFDNATWRLDGVGEDGVYPIYPRSHVWYLDKNRKAPVLGVTRRHLPLIPGFAITAYCSQGKTLLAALLDLNVDSRVDKSFGVVGASRVCSREAGPRFLLTTTPVFSFGARQKYTDPGHSDSARFSAVAFPARRIGGPTALAPEIARGRARLGCNCRSPHALRRVLRVQANPDLRRL